MARYQIWDGVSDIYTPSGKMYTADEWKEQYEWLKIPGVKAVISGGVINGAFVFEFEDFKQGYISRGLVITDDMTDEDILLKIEEIEGMEGGNGDPIPDYRDKDVIEFENQQVISIMNNEHTKGPFPIVNIYKTEQYGMYSKISEYQILFGDYGEIEIKFYTPQTGKVVIQ